MIKDTNRPVDICIYAISIENIDDDWSNEFQWVKANMKKEKGSRAISMMLLRVANSPIRSRSRNYIAK